MSFLSRILSLLGISSSAVDSAEQGLELAQKVKGFVEAYKKNELASQLVEELKDAGREEVDARLTDEATAQFDQHIMPFIQEKNIPSAIAEPARDKAIEALVPVMREKLEEKLGKRFQ